MSDDYALTVYNDNGGLMFDSRRKMSSYVVTEVGTGVQPVDTDIDLFEDLVFIRPPAGQRQFMTQYVIFRSIPSISTDSDGNGNPILVNNGKFYGYDIAADDGTADELVLDYFVAKHSSRVTSDEEYGLLVSNEDGSTQFDSRSVKTGNHFNITTAAQPRSYNCWRPDQPADSLGDITDYWEIGTWSWGMGLYGGGGILISERMVQGLQFVGGGTSNGNTGPIVYSWFSVDPNDGFNAGDPGEPGSAGNTTSNNTYKRKIDSLILSAELV